MTIEENKQKWDQVRKQIGQAEVLEAAFHTIAETIQAIALIKHELDEKDLSVYYDTTSVDSQLMTARLFVLGNRTTVAKAKKMLLDNFRCSVQKHYGDAAGSMIFGAVSDYHATFNGMPLEANVEWRGGVEH